MHICSIKRKNKTWHVPPPPQARWGEVRLNSQARNPMFVSRFYPNSSTFFGNGKNQIFSYHLFKYCWIYINCSYCDIVNALQYIPEVNTIRSSHTVHSECMPRVDRVLSFFSSRWNWDSPASHRRWVCPPPLAGGGGVHTRWRERGWGVPIPTREYTPWYSMYIVHVFFVVHHASLVLYNFLVSSHYCMQKFRTFEEKMI